VKFGSVCSGIEAASVAWNPLGWQAEFLSEIDPFPCAVLAQRHPTAPNFGDMTKFKEWPDATIHVLVGGTPCQSFSVAGLRKGLADPRGNLMLTYLAIAARYRPEWLVWENVPGVLSSNAGRDFGSFLGGLGELGYGFAYRVLDAQYFGLAQRRQRVFVVGCLGGWRRAAAVLFERASLRGDSAPSREKGQNAAASLTSGSHPNSNAAGRRREDDVNLVPFAPAGHAGYSEGVGALRAWGGDLGGGSETLLARPILSHGGRFDYATDNFVTHSLRADGFDASEDGTGRGTPLTLAIRGRAGESTLECREDGLANAILTPNGGRGGIGVGAVAFQASASASNSMNPSEVAPTLDIGKAGSMSVAFAQNQRDEVREMAIAGALAKETGSKQQTYVNQQLAVRRLTPRECERLQGFPDDYTAITYRGKPAADGPRYKALGNSMAVPVMAWIGKRIKAVSKL
jgi:DNA (cytosine-5)-methyltransferase 1